MILKDILNCKNCNFEISGISRDSKNISKGDVYFCLTDDPLKAWMRSNEALSKGASCVVSEIKLNLEHAIKVKDVRASFSKACKKFYQNACDDLKIIGVTGTNGKTTICHVIAQILSQNGKKVGVIGTNGVFYCDKTFSSPLTTPDADFLHKTFLDMKNCGVGYVVMEVSAHAIDQKRIEGIKFEVGVLTNITQDHLDYFETFENYMNCKFKFFKKKYLKQAVICVDDEQVRKLKTDVKTTTYGIKNPSDAFGMELLCTIDGSQFLANICDHVFEVKTKLIGEYNVYNTLASMTVCKKLGLSDDEISKSLQHITAVEGRFNVINFDGKYVVIDFAHTPDGLEKVLKTARGLTDKKIIVIFGCGGCRDRDKRHKMGKIAEDLADVVCLTDDNPRLEKSEDIIKEIEMGIQKEHFVFPDRAVAIQKMIELSSEGDIVIIAGKGAEKYQEIGSIKYPFSDFEVVKNLLNLREDNKICQ